jgi:heme exporter protein C
MEKSKLGRIVLVGAAILMLLTTYLAVIYVPLPQTSVKSADKILSSVEGSRIRVAGFVSEVFYNITVNFGQIHVVRFSIADFSDYERYLVAAASGDLDSQWWAVRPIDVEVIVQKKGYIMGSLDVPLNFGNRTNLSVLALVADHGIGLNSNVTGSWLRTSSWDDVTIGTSPGQFGIMTAPVAQKIFYFHMPSAWVSYLAFFVTLVASALYLKTRNIKYDRWAFSSAQLGVLFATIAITTGPVWAKQEWGVYWRWDDTKLVTTFVLWLVYIGYLMLRGSMTDTGTRARVGAVYGILGFVTVPMSLLSSRVAPLLQSSHPQVIASNSGSLSPEAGMTIGVAIIAFTLLFITMLIRRVEIAESEDELEELKRTVGGED